MKIILIICDILLIICLGLNIHTIYKGIIYKNWVSTVLGLLGIGVCLWSLLY